MNLHFFAQIHCLLIWTKELFKMRKRNSSDNHHLPRAGKSFFIFEISFVFKKPKTKAFYTYKQFIFINAWWTTKLDRAGDWPVLALKHKSVLHETTILVRLSIVLTYSIKKGKRKKWKTKEKKEKSERKETKKCQLKKI